jgi:hypothetical protein
LGAIIGNLLMLTTGGVMVVAMIIVVGIWRTGSQFLTTMASLFTAPQPKAEVDVRSLIVQEIRGASDLTTAVFAMEAVVPTRQDRTLGSYTIGTTKLLYIAYGEVRAGVDLSQMTSDDITLEGDRLTIQLPPPEILDSKIDVTRSQVYEYDRGFLGLGPDVGPELQTLAQQQTLERIVTTACREDILGEANLRAEGVVSQLLTTAGYSQVTVETQAPTTTSCQVAEAPPSSIHRATITSP